MKKSIVLAFILIAYTSSLFAQQESAYFYTESKSNFINSSKTVKSTLEEAGFRIIGEYNPSQSEDLMVICYTNNELEKIALNFTDRGSLAAALKVGIKKDEDGVKISMLNPMYLFYAYFVDGIDKYETELRTISDQALAAVQKLGELKPFGGTLEKKKLQKYHYKVMMPYFKNAEKLKEFISFEEGLSIIQKNLESGKAETRKVYELVYSDKNIAVWGVGLENIKSGEAKFLPIIGDDHIAAMPYEIILQGKTASILPGKYRIALHWPELTMGTFMKIMSTPGDIRKNLQELTN